MPLRRKKVNKQKRTSVKIRFLGTGNFSTTRKCTSFSLDDRMLFDIGFGTLNSLRENNLDVTDIDTIIVSHFHPDHVGDILYFIIRHWELSKENTDRFLQIIGPVGMKEYIINLRNVFLGTDGVEDISLLISHIRRIIDNTVELDAGQAFENYDFSIKSFKVSHGTAVCNGYLFEYRGRRFGYTGDTCYCSSLAENIRNADTWIVDTSFPEGRHHKRHMSLEIVNEFALENPTKKFYTVHRRDYAVPMAPANIIFPKDNQIFID